MNNNEFNLKTLISIDELYQTIQMNEFEETNLHKPLKQIYQIQVFFVSNIIKH